MVEQGKPTNRQAPRGNNIGSLCHNLTLKPGKQIVQAWRTSDFGTNDPDSTLEIRLEKAKTGTKLTLIHSGAPSGTEATYKDGWREYYFAPMKEYFGRQK